MSQSTTLQPKQLDAQTAKCEGPCAWEAAKLCGAAESGRDVTLIAPLLWLQGDQVVHMHSHWAAASRAHSC